MLVNYLAIFLVAFLFSSVLCPLVLWFVKKIKASQTILHYVEEHKTKQGTPTMGGLIFIFGTLLACLAFFNKDSSLAYISIFVMFGYGILGFLDDFIKIRFKQNLGLKPYQKIIGQVGIALIISIFAYKSNLVGGLIYLPFSLQTLNLGPGIIPFIVFVYIALVNSVNLIDGLDGLAGGVSFVFSLAIGIIISLLSGHILDNQLVVEQQHLSLLAFGFCGAMLPYLVLNIYPAKIFMGDTGSLAIGGLLTSLCVFSRQALLIPIIGILFVVTAVSDIIQVIHYKRTKKRIFLMAPLHHHFQKKGVNENKIVFVYIVITAIVSVITILLMKVIGGY